MKIKIEYKDGHVFTTEVDEKNVRNITACLLDEVIPIWREEGGFCDYLRLAEDSE